MKCNECGVDNKKGASFCVNCGSELPKSNTEKNQNDCLHCGSPNLPGNKFCVSCGRKLSKVAQIKSRKSHERTKIQKVIKKKPDRNRKRIKNRKSTNSELRRIKPLWIWFGVTLGSVILVFSFDSIFRPSPNHNEPQFERISKNPIIEAGVYDIASKFVCSCGSCNEEPLETCTCPTAIEEREIIRKYLQQNQDPDQIVLAVANRYGWLKSEFASNYNVNENRIFRNKKIEINNPENNYQQLDLENVIASRSDRTAIYDAFYCPCGQCGFDELLDCNCDHPGGARNVKSFIDKKISEETYTVNEIISLVDNKYGGKK
jgi:hypothetical protein